MDSLKLDLSEATLERLASMIAAKLQASQVGSDRRPLTVKEAAKALNVSYDTMNVRIKSGLIRTIDGLGCRRIARAEIDRLLTESAPLAR